MERAEGGMEGCRRGVEGVPRGMEGVNAQIICALGSVSNNKNKRMKRNEIIVYRGTHQQKSKPHVFTEPRNTSARDTVSSRIPCSALPCPALPLMLAILRLRYRYSSRETTLGCSCETMRARHGLDLDYDRGISLGEGIREGGKRDVKS